MPWKHFCVGALTVGMVAWLFTMPSIDHTIQVGAGEPKQKQLTKLYFGVGLCKKCHDEMKPVADKDALLYRGTEMHTWNEFDKHKDATRVLKGDRGQQMAQLLGYDVRNDRRCLNCHGVVVANMDEFDEGSFSPEQREESGVSCVVCHGPYKEWVNNHAAVIGSTWKKLSRAEKERDHGLRDLWDPATRAALCCSCHIGSVKEGKVVTHEMYAAGHPPLPGIEVATFSDAMPRHWEYLSEKVAKRPQHKDFHQRIHGYDADKGEVEQARLLAVSSLVALRTSVQLMHDLAKQEATAPNAKDPAWPELAAFDCYACHHDLRSESWRQLRGYAGRPGRPPMRTWPTAILPALQLLDKQGAAVSSDGFRTALKDLTNALDATPFGEPRTVADKSSLLLVESEKLLQAMQAARYDKQTARDMLKALAALPEKRLLDFDSARQIAWAARALMSVPSPGGMKPSPLPEPFLQLENQLKLDLPLGQVRIADQYFPEVLKRIAAYDPRKFQSTMGELSSAIAKLPPP